MYICHISPIRTLSLGSISLFMAQLSATTSSFWLTSSCWLRPTPETILFHSWLTRLASRQAWDGASDGSEEDEEDLAEDSKSDTEDGLQRSGKLLVLQQILPLWHAQVSITGQKLSRLCVTHSEYSLLSLFLYGVVCNTRLRPFLHLHLLSYVRPCLTVVYRRVIEFSCSLRLARC